ncbi:MAG: hypothetical protein JW940_16835 [Polyangiaceae bacterium]|nr:hypothetical protein [Polyangiaceae bacterium]
MDPKVVLAAFDAHLAARHLRLEAVVIGGAALNLLGVVHRTTKDCDILHPALPQAVVEAAKEFAALRRADGDVLADDWLNNGPQSLAPLLPTGWQERLVVVFEGDVIVLRSLGRLDLLRSKVFSLCDRALDLNDCVALAPTPEELREIEPWLALQDGNPDWPDHVRSVLEDLGRRLGYVV